MNKQLNIFNANVTDNSTDVKPEPVLNGNENDNDMRKFKKKLIREGYTVKRKKVDGCMIETFTRGKQQCAWRK